jgi:alanyl-tRNA synthetase
MKGSDIRGSFLDFFAERGHRREASAPLVPQSDPTLLFVNAGMVPFKSYFLGLETPPATRATSSQKCLRVSGKHNDLENVGPSHRHHTFFEMLGNFSFGDYFKAEAIELAWELVTDVWGIDSQHLFATVFREDQEAFDLWAKISTLPAERIVRCGAKDNFWAMGDTGPCGPCSELHIDRRPDLPAVSWEEGSESGRYFEFWNLVFMQFDCDQEGELHALPNPSIDTGAGLERLASVLQQVESNYDTDLFAPLLAAAADLAGVRYGGENSDVALRVVADHLRAVGFLLADGVIPANEGRGYVLRRILRRAVRHGLRIGMEDAFLYRLLPVLADTMSVYPELRATLDASQATVLAEEEKFLSTVAIGARHVQDAIEMARGEGRSHLAGGEAFRLYDTYGLPIEMLREILEEEGFGVDEAGFSEALDEQRERSRAATGRTQAQVGSLGAALIGGEEIGGTRFEGYDTLQLEGANVVRLARRGDETYEAVDALDAGESGAALLDRSVFYAESGGQVGDVGELVWPGGRARVGDTQKDPGGRFFHLLEVLEGRLDLDGEVELRVDADRRGSTERNHTATHLLHAALRAELGGHVRQAGSLVHPDRLRFDYTFDRPLGAEERERLEDLVAGWVLRAVPTRISETDYDSALEAGAMALFGEKYGDRVRTVEVPGFSLELCGGCHVRNTGEIGAFRIVGERGVASGVRRIEAVSGEGARELARRQDHLLSTIEDELTVPSDRVVAELGRLKSRLRESEKELKALRLQKLAGAAPEESVGVEETVEGVRVISREVALAPSDELRSTADVLRERLGSGVVVLGAKAEGRVVVVAAVSSDLTDRLHAGRLAKALGELVGGNGGGRADFAQAGGKDPARLEAALAAVPEMVAAQLGA